MGGAKRNALAELGGRTRASAPWFVLVTTFGFPENDREAAAAEAEALRDRSSDPDLGAVAGHAVSLAVNPDLTRTVVHLIDAGAESSERIADSSTDGNFPAQRTAPDHEGSSRCWYV